MASTGGGSVLSKAGTRFPFINLEKALERAKSLFEADQKGRDVSILGAFEVWGYSAKSSGGFQTIGALKMYGLLKDSGGGDSRKVALTEDALRYFRDERELEKLKLAKQFAMKPKLLNALWNDWQASPPADTVARSHLKTEAKLNDQSARTLLAIYKENMAFAELKGGDKIRPSFGEPKGQGEEEIPPSISIGEYVQWTSNGVDQFPSPRRVNWVSEDGQFARVHGSITGIPMSELTVVDAPKPPPAGGEPKQTESLPPDISSPRTGGPDINILMTGQRLQITADVDLAGVAKLKQALEKYEELLKLLQ